MKKIILLAAILPIMNVNASCLSNIKLIDQGLLEQVIPSTGVLAIELVVAGVTGGAMSSVAAGVSTTALTSIVLNDQARAEKMQKLLLEAEAGDGAAVRKLADEVNTKLSVKVDTLKVADTLNDLDEKELICPVDKNGARFFAKSEDLADILAKVILAENQ